MTDAVLLPASFALLAVATAVAVLSAWDHAQRLAAAATQKYARWADDNLRALHIPLSLHGFFVRHLALVAAAIVIGVQLGDGGQAALFGIAAALLPVFYFPWAVKRRRKMIEQQLDVTLQTIANNMLATQSLLDGFRAVTIHLLPPISQEADSVVKDVRVGARMEEALAHLAERCQNQYVDAVVTALAMGIRSGGDLGKVLKTIAGVVRESIRVELVVAAKTSEGKASAWVMGAMPVVFLMAMQKAAPEWTEPLWHDELGSWVLIAVAALTLAGMYTVYRISKVDI